MLIYWISNYSLRPTIGLDDFARRSWMLPPARISSSVHNICKSVNQLLAQISHILSLLLRVPWLSYKPVFLRATISARYPYLDYTIASGCCPLITVAAVTLDRDRSGLLLGWVVSAFV